MAQDYNAITDGTFSLQESDDKKQFYFYRNDGGKLTDQDDPMDLFHAYIMSKMMSGEITGMITSNIRCEKSEDDTTLRITLLDFTETPISIDITPDYENKQPGFLKRWFHKIFG